MSDLLLLVAMIVGSAWSFENPSVAPVVQGLLVVSTPIMLVAVIRTRLDDWFRGGELL